MSKIKQNLNYKDKQEIVYFLARSNFIIYWKYWLISGLLILTSAFFLYPLFLQGWWGIILDIFLAILGIVIFLKGYIIWYFSYWKITNNKIIDVFQSGFFNQEKTEINYSDIENVYGQRKGLFQGLLQLGDVFIKIKNSKTKLKLPAKQNYSQLISLINERKEEYLNSLAATRETKARLLLVKIKAKLGEDKFNELIFD
mgnify:CR=1 FL=1